MCAHAENVDFCPRLRVFNQVYSLDSLCNSVKSPLMHAHFKRRCWRYLVWPKYAMFMIIF